MFLDCDFKNINNESPPAPRLAVGWLEMEPTEAGRLGSLALVGQPGSGTVTAFVTSTSDHLEIRWAWNWAFSAGMVQADGTMKR